MGMTESQCPKLALRPLLQLPEVAEGNDVEFFQNQVLRPVLKLQHDLLIMHLDAEPGFRKAVHGKQLREEHLQAALQWLQKNIPARNVVIGMVVGMLTTDEHFTYLKHRSELNKRIVNMVCQRHTDTTYPETRI
jgi:hypothetical protein